MSAWEPTGKRRLRPGVSRVLNDVVDVLILQIEEQKLETEFIGGFASSGFVYRWRDATVQDVTEGVYAE